MRALDRLSSTLADGRLDTSRGREGLALARVGVVLTVGLCLALVVPYFVRALDRLGDDAALHAQANYDDRELGGGLSVLAESRAVYEARGRIPEDGTYRVVAGPNVEGATELTEQYVDQFLRSFLMPRRPSPEGDWVLCYGCDRSELEGAFEVVWEAQEGVSLWSRR